METNPTGLGPQINIEFEENVPTKTSRTFKIDWERKRISGMIDDIEAIQQLVGKILLTERYKYLIYDDEFGIELEQILYGDYPIEYAESECKRVITESLSYDERILEITSVKIDIQNDEIYAEVCLKSIFGEVVSNKKIWEAT